MDTTQSLKRKVMKEGLVKSRDIASFYFAGQMPNDKTLQQCHIHNGSTIHLLDGIQSKHSKMIRSSSSKVFMDHNYHTMNDEIYKGSTSQPQQLQMVDLSKKTHKQSYHQPLISSDS